MAQKKIIVANSLTEYAQKFFYLDGQPFCLKNRPHLEVPYNHNKKKTLFLFSRQAEKSTTLAAKSLCRSLLCPHFRTLYIAPRETQVKQFVNQKLAQFSNSPVVRANFVNKGCASGFFYRTFSNGSDYTLRSAFLSADGARGISADSLYIDEFQDILRDHLPVIESALQHGKDWAKYRELAGTPKSLQNHIEFEWRKSLQYEWAIKCEGCNRYNILDKSNIGKNFMICSHCGKQIHSYNGQWVCTNREGTFPAFRICYLMVPWAVWSDPNDKEAVGVIQMFENWPDDKFLNEVLAISADSANIPITMDQLKAACEPFPMMETEEQYKREISPIIGRLPDRIYAGVDWGTSEENKSATVLSIGAFFPNGTFRILYMKKYNRGTIGPEEEVDDIASHIRRWRVSAIGSDWGFGYVQNGRLSRLFPEKLKSLYSHGKAGKYIVYNPDTKIFAISKHVATERFLHDIIRKNVRFFNWTGGVEKEGFEVFSPDFLAIRREFDLTNRLTRYFHRVTDADDCFYSANYCYCAGQIDRNDFLVKDSYD